MKQYMLSVHGVQGTPEPTEAEMQQTYADVAAVNKQLKDAGAWVFAGGLHPPATATVVRAQDDRIITTDGPFTETKEFLGGFWVIQVEDLDTALTWARKATVACRGPVEVRPFQDNPESSSPRLGLPPDRGAHGEPGCDGVASLPQGVRPMRASLIRFRHRRST